MANMIFQATWEQVVSGAKTQTRRIVKWDEYKAPYGLAVPKETIKSVRVPRSRNGVELPSHVVYEVGKQYAVMPARGVRGLRKVADIQITCIRREDVREISEADAVAEGFGYKYYPSEAYFGFIETWASMHDPAFKFWYEPRIVDYMWYTSQRQMNQGQSEVGGWEHLLAAIKSRPAAHYDAWVLDFRVVAVYADAIEIARQLLQEAA